LKSRRVLENEELQMISLFESLTGATVKDCFLDPERRKVLFVVAENQLGVALGRRGQKINKIRRILGYNIDVVEEAKDDETFIRKLLSPARINYIKITERGGQKIAYVSVDERDKGLAIGREGRNINRVREIARIYRGIAHIKIM